MAEPSAQNDPRPPPVPLGYETPAVRNESLVGLTIGSGFVAFSAIALVLVSAACVLTRSSIAPSARVVGAVVGMIGIGFVGWAVVCPGAALSRRERTAVRIGIGLGAFCWACLIAMLLAAL